MLLQGKCFTNFRLEVDLVMADEGSLEQLMTHAADIASVSALLLHQHGVVISISLYSRKERSIAPPPAFIQQLAPFLTKIDLYSVATAQTSLSQQMRLCCSAFTSAHITALQSCSNSLTVLCISDQKLTLGHGTLLTQSIPAIAYLSGLTKLHLSLATSNPVADFQPLSQICTLKDIALQCSGGTASCSDVIISCSQTLRMVTLAAGCWSSATYDALGQIPLLERLVIKLSAFDTEQAQGLSCLKANTTKLELFDFMHISDAELLEWSKISRDIHVHELTLWAVEDDRIGLLESMPAMKALRIVQSPNFTGSTLQRHLGVTNLALVSCPSTDVQGLQHMLATALPNIQDMAFHSARADAPGTCLHLCPTALRVLACGKRLTNIDLRGIHGLTEAGKAAVRSQFAHTSVFGRASSFIVLQLPFEKLDQHQPVVDVCSSLYIPSWHLTSGHDNSERVAIRLKQDWPINVCSLLIVIPLILTIYQDMSGV